MRIYNIPTAFYTKNRDIEISEIIGNAFLRKLHLVTGHGCFNVSPKV